MPENGYDMQNMKATLTNKFGQILKISITNEELSEMIYSSWKSQFSITQTSSENE